MQTTDTATLLEVAPQKHSRRCALALGHINAGRWAAAASGLRGAAAVAQGSASQMLRLAAFCDERLLRDCASDAASASPATSPEPAVDPAPTLESIEAGLMALAHTLGLDQALRVRRAMNGVLSAQSAQPACHGGRV